MAQGGACSDIRAARARAPDSGRPRAAVADGRWRRGRRRRECVAMLMPLKRESPPPPLPPPLGAQQRRRSSVSARRRASFVDAPPSDQLEDPDTPSPQDYRAAACSPRRECAAPLRSLWPTRFESPANVHMASADLLMRLARIQAGLRTKIGLVQVPGPVFFFSIAKFQRKLYCFPS